MPHHGTIHHLHGNRPDPIAPGRFIRDCQAQQNRRRVIAILILVFGTLSLACSLTAIFGY